MFSLFGSFLIQNKHILKVYFNILKAYFKGFPNFFRHYKIIGQKTKFEVWGSYKGKHYFLSVIIPRNFVGWVNSETTQILI